MAGVVGGFFCFSLVFFGLGFVVAPVCWSHTSLLSGRALFGLSICCYSGGAEERQTQGWKGSSCRYGSPGALPVPDKGQHCPQPLSQPRWMQEEPGVWSRPHQRDAADKGIPSPGPNLQISFLPCPPGIVIQTLRRGKLMIYRSSQPTQSDTRDLAVINW